MVVHLSSAAMHSEPCDGREGLRSGMSVNGREAFAKEANARARGGRCGRTDDAEPRGVERRCAVAGNTEGEVQIAGGLDAERVETAR